MEQIFYAAKNKKDNIRKKSSSGGVFYELASYIIKQKGVVYGATYDQYTVKHKRASTESEIVSFLGSKYSQSSLTDVVDLIKEDLNTNKLVLFSGTPCQVKLIKNLFKDYNNLFTIDVICHGVPQSKYLEDYIKYQENRYNSKLKSINMRYKSKKEYNKHLKKKYIKVSKVDPHNMYLVFNNGKEYYSRSDYDIYYQLFDLFMLPGCFKCPFASLTRVSDITIGDFHEFSCNLESFNDGNGVSLIIINTENGKKIFNNVSDNFLLSQKKESECIQPALKSPAIKPANYEKFDYDYINKGIDYAYKKYGVKGIKYNIKKYLYKLGILDYLKIKKVKINEKRKKIN